MKLFVRLLILVGALICLGIGGYQLFKPQLAEMAFRKAVKAGVGVDRSQTLPDGLHVFVCGAGTPLPDPKRSGACLGVLAGSKALVIDAGSGGSRNLTRMGFPLSKVDHVYLTHLHSDHMDGLGELLMQAWVNGQRDEPLPVSGPRGVDEVIDGFNQAYRIDGQFRTAHHGVDIANPAGRGGEGDVISLPAGPGSQAIVYEDGDLTITAYSVSHAPVEPAFGYRIDYKDRSVSISGDTIYDPNLVANSRDVDLLFHEALNPEMVGVMRDAAKARGQDHIAQIMDDILTYHATPLDAARAAKEANARQLVFYHTIPPMPSKVLYGVFTKGTRDIYDGKITVSEDGMIFSLPSGTDKVEMTKGF